MTVPPSQFERDRTKYTEVVVYEDRYKAWVLLIDGKERGIYFTRIAALEAAMLMYATSPFRPED